MEPGPRQHESDYRGIVLKRVRHMPELIVEYPEHLRAPDGERYAIRVFGDERDDGTWLGWIDFVSTNGVRRRTERETTQPSREALLYWASGLEPLYFEGAFARSVLA
jgi:hypothetical protein